MTSISTEQFRRDIEAAEVATSGGPVVVIDGDIPEYVFLTYKDFAEMKLRSKTLAESLSMPKDAGGEIDFEIPEMKEMGWNLPAFD